MMGRVLRMLYAAYLKCFSFTSLQPATRIIKTIEKSQLRKQSRPEQAGIGLDIGRPTFSPASCT